MSNFHNNLYCLLTAEAAPSTDHLKEIALDGLVYSDNNVISISRNTFIAGAGNIYLHQSPGLSITIAGNPYISQKQNMREIADDFANLYKKTGKNSFKELCGQFILIINDHNNNCSYIVQDKIGQKQLYYHMTEGKLFASTSVQLLASNRNINCSISNNAIFGYFYFHCIPTPLSIYNEIEKLSGGEYIEYSSGKPGIKRYWKPVFSEPDDFSISGNKAILQKLVQESVGRFVQNGYIGSFLSGGLDSSTVSGMLSKCQPDKADTFSIGFTEKDYDETGYARMAVEHFHTNQHEMYVTPELTANTIPKIIDGFEEPFGNSSALPTYFCASMARENGIKLLLAGDGGDEIFAGNERYRKQKVFEKYKLIPWLIRNPILDPIGSMSFLQKIPLLSKVYRYIYQAKIPLPDRLEDYNFLNRHSHEEMFKDDFLRDVTRTQPINTLREWYSLPDNSSYINRMLYMDWNRTLHDNDLVKVNSMCELAGVDVAYPLLDDSIIEFSCHIPSHLKLRGKTLRWFFKEAFKDFLPAGILNKSKHGFGLPFGVWTKSNKLLQTIAYDNLSDFKKRNILTNTFIDKTIERHSKIHASYYGELVWVIMMLELWFKKNNI